MKINLKGLLTFSAVSVAFSRPLSADFIYSDSVTTTGGEFNSSFGVDHLIEAGFTSASDTVDSAASGTAGHASSAYTISDFTITFDFSTSQDLSAIHIWNYVHLNSSQTPNGGVKNFTLTFYDAVSGGGNAIGSVFSGEAAKVVIPSVFAADTITFSEVYYGARSVVMEVDSNHGQSQYTGMHEVAFATIPEPSQTAFVFAWLVLLGGCVRRRR